MYFFQSNIVPLYGVAETRQGGRAENQDDWGFVDTPLGFLLIVCDGMGGGPGGKTASYIAKYEIMKSLCECDTQMQRDRALKMAIGKANEALTAKIKQVPALAGMGSTLVAILVNRQSAIVAHVGDSRCYRIHDNHVVFCTQDHSLVGELVRKKVLTPEQARTSPQSNVITRNLGHAVNNVPQIDEVPFKRGDRFVLCTDGVWGMMSHEDIVKRLTSKSNIKQIVENLSIEIDQIGSAKGGHHDNHTLGILEMQCDSLTKDTRMDWKKLTFGLLLLCLIVIGMFFFFVKKEKTNQYAKTKTTIMSEIYDEQYDIPKEKQPSACGKLDSIGIKLLPIEKLDSLRKDSIKKDSLKKDSVKSPKKKKATKESKTIKSKKSSLKSQKSKSRQVKKQTNKTK